MPPEVYLDGLRPTPQMTLCGVDFYIRSGSYKYNPRAKAVTEKLSLMNCRRRQIAWDPRQWEFVAVFATQADMQTMESLYYGETYASYLCAFYDGHLDATYNVTLDLFDPVVIGDNSERWDAKIQLTEWI
jgi:hypothetical protein